MQFTIEFTPTKEKTFCFKHISSKRIFTTKFYRFEKDACEYVHAHLLSGRELIASTDIKLGVGILDTELLQDYVDMLLVGSKDEIRKVDGKFGVYAPKTYSRADMIHALTYGHTQGKRGISHGQTLLEYREEHL